MNGNKTIGNVKPEEIDPEAGSFKERFARFKLRQQEEAAARKHRKWRRLTLRLERGLVEDLHVLKAATGIDINRIVEETLALALKERIEALRRGFGDDAWTGFVTVIRQQAGLGAD